MKKDEIQKRLDKLSALAKEKGVYEETKRFPARIKQSLKEANPNFDLINAQLDSLKKNINDESNPEFILTRLRKQLMNKKQEITHHDLNQHAKNNPYYHPFELLQYTDIEDQINIYHQKLNKLTTSYQRLIDKLPQTVKNKSELKDYLIEQQDIDKQYNEIKKNRPVINKISREETLKNIIDKNRDKLELRGFCGKTPLIEFAARGKQNFLQVLLEEGADINAQCDLESTEQGNTALTWSIANAYADQALWLINHGKKYHINYDLLGHGNTALILAIAKGPTHITDDRSKQIPGGFRKIILALVDQGANVNLKDKKNGFSPLHLAVLHRDSEIIEKLIAAGADINAEDKLKRKPLDMLNIPPEGINKILNNQCGVFTVNKDNWEQRGAQIHTILAPLSSPTKLEPTPPPKVTEENQLESSVATNEFLEGSAVISVSPKLLPQLQEPMKRLSDYAIKLKVDSPTTSRQREGNTKAEKIQDLMSDIQKADSIEAIQTLVNKCLESRYEKGRQQNPLLINRGLLHTYWIHSIFSKKRNTQAQRLSRSTTEDLLIDLKKEVDAAVEAKPVLSGRHSS